MRKPGLQIVIPTYGHFEYAARAVASASANTTHCYPHVVVVDDASPELAGGALDDPGRHSPGFVELMRVIAEIPADHAWCHYFPTNGGLTRSWNWGLRTARAFDHAYCCVTNSDVVFQPGWDEGLVTALRDGYDLVGPVTNAPGTNREQYVGLYTDAYDRRVGDDPGHAAAVQRSLRAGNLGRAVPTTLNGFCLFARTATWWAGAYDAEHVFRPRNDVNSRGEPNPTPLMTLNEYELQARWRAAGRRTGVALDSYVFHYRAVSRGDGHRKGDWTRIGKA